MSNENPCGIKHTPIADGELCYHVPAKSQVCHTSYPILVHRPTTLDLDFLQTTYTNALVLLLAFGLCNYLKRAFNSLVFCHAARHTRRQYQRQ